ncbi:Schizosaccharomyces specific protein Tam12 [Schizosaccharomyces osmophilus]|uniref:Schizosaccharomyces specific protein Tam12 n=1 Tax=Schizosaccharomyces osmophilus TaxID=2545709 RepID=A0AAF0ARY5_9SCHI|nr:Schizosaccharomyces specific protein Tam12 [Schizosaccharomyces osmophilus]WBW70726.1 Schizosaccharomyces specific protein Tam12 [Schizosaccharomyces osmophilus]
METKSALNRNSSYLPRFNSTGNVRSTNLLAKTTSIRTLDSWEFQIMHALQDNSSPSVVRRNMRKLLVESI